MNVKQPVHSVKRVENHIVVMRLKAPKFFAIYNPDLPGELQNIQYENGVPPNAESLQKKALAAVKSFLHAFA